MTHKKIIASFLAFAMVFTAMLGNEAFNASAALASPESVVSDLNEPISVRWDNVSRVSTSITFNSSTATCKTEIVPFSGATAISAEMRLYVKNSNGTYTELAKWTAKNTGSTLRMSETYSITSGKTYKLTVSANVTRNGTTEPVSGQVEVQAP